MEFFIFLIGDLLVNAVFQLGEAVLLGKLVLLVLFDYLFLLRRRECLVGYGIALEHRVHVLWLLGDDHRAFTFVVRTIGTSFTVLVIAIRILVITCLVFSFLASRSGQCLLLSQLTLDIWGTRYAQTDELLYQLRPFILVGNINQVLALVIFFHQFNFIILDKALNTI